MIIRNQLALLAVAVTVLTLTPSAASASASVPAPPSTETAAQDGLEAGLTATGEFDVAVAEANGFKIITREDGMKQSVPVTPGAIAEQERAERLTKQHNVLARGEANMGNCGKSWIDAAKGANDQLTLKTGFQTYMSVNSFRWDVAASALIRGTTVSWKGGAVGTSWSGKSTKTVIGPGVAQLRLSQDLSYVLLVNGTKCQNSIPGPMDTFS